MKKYIKDIFNGQNKIDGYENFHSNKERLNLSLPKELISFLKEISNKKHKSLTATIIDIIMFHKTIYESIKNGYKLALEDSSGKNNYLLIDVFI